MTTHLSYRHSYGLILRSSLLEKKAEANSFSRRRTWLFTDAASIDSTARRRDDGDLSCRESRNRFDFSRTIQITASPEGVACPISCYGRRLPLHQGRIQYSGGIATRASFEEAGTLRDSAPGEAFAAGRSASEGAGPASTAFAACELRS